MRILIVSSSSALSDGLQRLLHAAGFQPACASSAPSGLDEALSDIYEAAVIDAALPPPGAHWLLRELRREDGRLHCLLLTAPSAGAAERTALLSAGADLCFPLPYNGEELVSQLRALLRRRQESYCVSPAFGDLTLELNSGLLWCGEKSVRLDRTELELMRLLVINGETLMSKESLLLRVWGYDTEAQPSIIETYISFLRKKLRLLGSEVRIETAYRRGYRLTAKE